MTSSAHKHRCHASARMCQLPTHGLDLLGTPLSLSTRLQRALGAPACACRQHARVGVARPGRAPASAGSPSLGVPLPLLLRSPGLLYRAGATTRRRGGSAADAPSGSVCWALGTVLGFRIGHVGSQRPASRAAQELPALRCGCRAAPRRAAGGPPPGDAPPGAAFWQPLQRQASLQCTPAWKHSQYFLRQRDLRHWQPRRWLASCTCAPRHAQAQRPAYLWAYPCQHAAGPKVCGSRLGAAFIQMKWCVEYQMRPHLSAPDLARRFPRLCCWCRPRTARTNRALPRTRRQCLARSRGL